MFHYICHYPKFSFVCFTFATYTKLTAPEMPATLVTDDEHHRGFCAEWTGPSTNFDRYVIAVLNEDGDVVYPAPEDAELPDDAPVYLSLPRDERSRCIDGLYPGVTYTFSVGTWVDGEPAPQFSEKLTADVMTGKRIFYYHENKIT